MTLLRVSHGMILGEDGGTSLLKMGEAPGTVQEPREDVQQQQQKPGCLSQSHSHCWPPQVFLAFLLAH